MDASTETSMLVGRLATTATNMDGTARTLTSTYDAASHRTQDRQDQADDGQDDADRVEDRDAEHVAQDDQDDTEDDHERLLLTRAAVPAVVDSSRAEAARAADGTTAKAPGRRGAPTSSGCSARRVVLGALTPRHGGRVRTVDSSRGQATP